LCGKAAFCAAKPAFGAPATFGFVLSDQIAKKELLCLLFLRGSNETQRTGWFYVGATGFETRQSLVSNPRQTGKK
jgi:hypothetical protein